MSIERHCELNRSRVAKSIGTIKGPGRNHTPHFDKQPINVFMQKAEVLTEVKKEGTFWLRRKVCTNNICTMDCNVEVRLDHLASLEA